MTPPPGSRVISCENAIRPPATANGPRFLRHTCIHRLSKSRGASENADRPTRRHARRWGDLASPSGDGRGPWAYGPGSSPPACTLLSRAYHEPHPPSSSRSKPLGRPPIPVTFPPTSSIRWNRNATLPRLGAKAGRTPRRSAATAAASAAARLRPVRRDGDSTLAFIERRFSLDSSRIQYPECKKSRLRGLPQRAPGSAAMVEW
jgi:hypothetical protein